MPPVRLAPLDLLGLGLIGLRTRPARAVLSALGIAIGIATMVVVTGIPASSQAALLDELTALGTNMLQATPAPDQDPPMLAARESASAMVAADRPGHRGQRGRRTPTPRYAATTASTRPTAPG